MYHSNNDDKNREVPALKSIIIIIFKKKNRKLQSYLCFEISNFLAQ
jgi:hypothetical protein